MYKQEIIIQYKSLSKNDRLVPLKLFIVLQENDRIFTNY